MRLIIPSAMAAMAAISIQPVLAGQDNTVVTVYMLNEIVAPGPVTIAAEAQAGQMFKAAGISVHWRSGKPRQPLSPNTFVIQMMEKTPKDYLPRALAQALPYERMHIQVFYQRIKDAVVPNTVPSLLAHVLVHEIAHDLQGINRHSDEGIMKAHWDANDYLVMQSRPLAFTQKDIDLIRRGLHPEETEALAEK